MTGKIEINYSESDGLMKFFSDGFIKTKRIGLYLLSLAVLNNTHVAKIKNV